MLLRNAWYIGAWADELADKPFARRICNDPGRGVCMPAPSAAIRAHMSRPMKTVRTPTGLKFTRWMRNSLAPPSYVKAAGFQGRIDRCQEFEFIAPNTVLQ